MDELFKFNKAKDNFTKDPLFTNESDTFGKKIVVSSLYGKMGNNDIEDTELHELDSSGNLLFQNNTFLNAFNQPNQPDKFHNSEFKNLINSFRFSGSGFREVKGYNFTLVNKFVGQSIIMESPNILMNNSDLCDRNSPNVSILLFLKIDDILNCISNHNCTFNQIIIKKNYMCVGDYDLEIPADMSNPSSIKSYFKRVSTKSSNEWYAIQLKVLKRNLIP